MGRYFRISSFVLIAVSLLAAPDVFCQDISLKVTLDRDTIGLDEQALLSVEISGSEQNLPDPQMPTLSMFEVYSQGRSSSIQIVNGQVSSTVTYRYVLVPTKPGAYPIDRIAVVHKNKRYKGNSVTLTVLDRGTATPPELEERAQGDDGQTRDYFLEAVVDDKSPYVNEQVTLTLKFFIGVKYYGSPELTEPTTTGFWTELLGNKAPYQQTINGRDYRVIERKYALFPTQTGELTIGRATISATVAAKSRRFRDPFDVFGDVFGRGEEVVIRSNSVTLNVRPLPAEGRPKDFTGTIGNFAISATPNKTQVEVNQPVSVTIKISGTGNVKSAAEPPIPPLDDFRVYQASASENISKLNDRIGGSKIYEEVFIPRRPGQLEIPALTFNFFNPASRKYETVSTRPIVLNVTKPEGYVASPEVPFSGPEMTISSQARDIRYIKENPGDFYPSGGLIIFSPAYVVVNGVPVLVLAVMMVMRRRREKLAGDIGYARARAASRMARKRLARARSQARVETAGEFFAEIYSALISYVADKVNASPHGLTADKIRQLMADNSVDDSVVEKMLQLMKACDFARYAPSSVAQESINEALVQAEQIMVFLEGVRFEK